MYLVCKFVDICLKITVFQVNTGFFNCNLIVFYFNFYMLCEINYGKFEKINPMV